MSWSAQVCLVGSRKLATFGDQNTADYVALRHFDQLQDCCSYLREDRGMRDSSFLLRQC